MFEIQDLNEIKEKIQEYWDREEFSAALKYIEECERDITHPYILIRKGMCLQLVDDPQGRYAPEEVPRLYKQALKLDNDYIEAYIELGWYTLNVEDDAEGALDYFEQAIKLSGRQFGEGLTGLFQASAETPGDEGSLNEAGARRHILGLLKNFQTDLEENLVE